MLFVIVPETGHETSTLLSSPTAPLTADQPVTRIVIEYEGFVLETAVPFGLTTTVVVLPISG